MIKVLSKDTIDKIAAGEVIERPASVVKELLENSIDAGSTAITVEIKNGGIDMIRITDNGYGIECGEVRTAFLRHATGKINDADDLMSIHSLGFRGEALSSIAAVTRTEIITKTRDNISAVRYVIEGGNEISYEEVGAPDGTTIITRDLFYNVPARKKFLKTASTEASHISELVEKLALSHPDISFRFINNDQIRLFTSGNGSIKDIVFRIYGRDITNSLISVDYESEFIRVSGLIAKPEVSRPNRNFEHCFVNGRYIKSTIISKAIEDAYGERMMQHQFPFAVLLIDVNPSVVDVNVHPTKMEVRFSKPYEIYDEINKTVKAALDSTVNIPHPSIEVNEVKPAFRYDIPVRPSEPFETRRDIDPDIKCDMVSQRIEEQLSFEEITVPAIPDYRIIGQVFSTYWIIEFNEKMYILDQHAAHEKIFYERLLAQQKANAVTSQLLNPPAVITLSDTEADQITRHYEDFKAAGYEIESFGGKEYAIRAIPGNLPSIDKAELLKDMIADYCEGGGHHDSMYVLEKTASMACKAAVKGGQSISFSEANVLIRELLKCDNPYCCPHGRPTMIEFTKNDLEKKFKRIV